MARSKSSKPYVAAIIERQDSFILIVRSSESKKSSDSTGDGPRWAFPRGRVKGDESPEAATRRTTREDLGIEVEIVVGQPPLAGEIGGERVELRFFFCGLISGGEETGPDDAIRWVPKHHLQEYEFDTVSQPVAAWLLET